jgi:2,4-dienoyl-CoA reductase (NADPH2)
VSLNKLFLPIRIGNMELPNRIYMSSMHLALEEAEDADKRMIDFYVERARGEVALMVTGGCAVSPEGALHHKGLAVWDDRDMEVLSRLTRSVHEAGGRIALQLLHNGRHSEQHKTHMEPVAPSPVRSKIRKDVPRELTDEEICELIHAYGSGAARAKSAGFDAVEVMGSEGVLINQFISPLTNHRQDHWGGSFENRIRFPLSIVNSIREQVGDDFPLIFRMSGMDLMPGGTEENETIELALQLEAHGIDALNIGVGWHESTIPTVYMGVPRGAFAHIGKTLKQHVRVPVIVSNRINRLELAEKLINQGYGDLVSMARPFLADAHLVKKGKENRLDEINTCIACNQACLDHIFDDIPASCLVNPTSVREAEFRLIPAQTTKRVLVIGAVPAGLECARVLSERGHQVQLIDKSGRIGGQLNLAKRVPGKQEFTETLRYYQIQLERLGVEVILNRQITEDDILAWNPDAVVIATGVRPRKPAIEGLYLPHVKMYPKALEMNRGDLGRRIAVIGGGGIACDVAHYCTGSTDIHEDPDAFLSYYGIGINQSNKRDEMDDERPSVTLMRRGKRIGQGLGMSTRWATLQLLEQHGVQFLTRIAYHSIVSDGVIVLKDGKEELITADTVVIAAGQEVENSLYLQIKNKVRECYVIGGAKEAGELDAKRAILEGNQIGRTI